MATAGWYHDPSGAFDVRWHNGTGWTEHVSNHGVQATSALPAAFESAPPVPPAPTAQATPSAAARPEHAPTRRDVFSHGLDGRPLGTGRQVFNAILAFVLIAMLLGVCGITMQ